MEILNYKKTEIQKSYVDFKASMDAVVERLHGTHRCCRSQATRV